MGEEFSYQESKAPFNMAIATLMSLRNTLDHIRDIEGRIDYPAEERQRIKVELVKRFYVDSSPLINNPEVIESYSAILKLRPIEVMSINRSNQKERSKIIYSYELNQILDEYLLKLQVQLQKNKYFMPPSDDMGSMIGKMS